MNVFVYFLFWFIYFKNIGYVLLKWFYEILIGYSLKNIVGSLVFIGYYVRIFFGRLLLVWIIGI